MKVDKNKRLCSKDVQKRIITALNVLDSESIHYIIRNNYIEQLRIDKAINALKDLRTNRSNQLGGF